MALGDVHGPWIHKPSFTRVLKLIETLSPTHIVQMGDLYDLFSYSKFPRTLDVCTPNQEIQNARLMGEEMWKAIRRRAPKAELHQILGNHDIRPLRRITEKYPEIASLIDISHLWVFDGVKTHHDVRTPLVINEIDFIHGYRSKLGDHAKYTQRSTVCGHSHRGGVEIIPLSNGKTIFELNAGYLADPEHEALKYTPMKFSKWTHGVGFIDELGPRFIPF